MIQTGQSGCPKGHLLPLCFSALQKDVSAPGRRRGVERGFVLAAKGKWLVKHGLLLGGVDCCTYRGAVMGLQQQPPSLLHPPLLLHLLRPVVHQPLVPPA